MSYLILPSRRTRQPQWDARLDSGWRWGVNFSYGPASREVVSKVLGTTGGDPVASGYSQGVGIKLASASSQYWQGPIANRPASFPISFVASFVVNNLSVAARLFTSGMASNYAGLCFWVTPAGSAYLGYGNDTTDQHDDGKYFIFTADGAIVVGKPYAFAATIKSGSITLFVNGSPVTGTLSGSASTIVNNGAPLVGRLDYSGSSYYCDATVGMVALGDLDLPSSELQSLSENPWQIFAPDPRRLYFAPSGGGTTTNERTVAARTNARGAATTTAIHAATTAGRIRARAADAVVPIHVETIAGRVTARGADARTSIHAGTAAGRVNARAANTVEHIDAGAVSRTVAGKVRARGAAATLAIRHTSIVGRVKAKAAETGTSTRLSLAAGRVRTRAAIAAAPVVPGMVITTAAGRIQARSAIVTTATRIEAIAGRVTARGTDATSGIRAATAAGRLRGRGAAAAGPYVAPTLPLEIPPSTRTIDRDPARLGLSPISPTKPRLG